MSVRPAKKNFVLFKRCEFYEPFIYKDPNDQPIDLTGCTIRWQARASIDDAEPFLDLSTTNGKIEVDPANGKFALRVSAEDTDDLDVVTNGVHDLLITPPSGAAHVFKLILGTIDVREGSTR